MLHFARRQRITEAFVLLKRYCQVKWNSRVLEAKSVVGRT